MNILSIIGFFTSLFSFGGIVDWIIEIFNKMLLFLDGVAYTLLAYSFKLFQLMCTLNFNSIYGIVSGVITRVEALIMVFVVYKLGIALINFMLNPDEASKKGKDILINIFITAALLLSYNTIFTLFNELSMLFIGTPKNYNYVVLGQIANVSNSSDVGLINRIVFGTNEQIEDVGQFIAFSTCSVFITSSSDPQNTAPLRDALNNNGEIDFYKLPDLASKIGKDFDYFYVVGFIGAIYMIFTFVKTTIQIGVRAFKLIILQIIAPIAIITIIGDGIKGKVFNSFLKKYISVYLEAITRMFSMLLICNFIVKFVRNIGDFFSDISADEWYTYALMILLILVAAFKFAGDIPKFIDEILGTHLSTGKDKNFIGGLLGTGIGAVAGFAGGYAGGGIGGGLVGLAKGALGGAQSGSKGNNVAEFFKGQGQIRKDALSQGQSIRARGGLGNVMLGGIQNTIGVGDAQDRELARLDRQSSALDALDAAEKYAVKDSKMGTMNDNGTYTSEFDTAWAADHGDFSNIYSSGYSDIKLGEDKDSYASKMLEYDRAYQDAQANYDNISGTDLSAFKSAIENDKGLLAEAQKQLDDARTNGSARDIASGEQLVKEYTSRLESSEGALAKEEQKISNAKRATEEARAAAEKRAKDYYDARKEHESNHSSDVASKRQAYIKSGGQSTSGKARTDEKRRIHDEKAAITNRSSYQRTHGGNPKK